MSQLAALGGLASRRELLDAYLAAGGRETSRLDWYLAMACFKLGIVIEGTWSRYLAGQASAEAGERLHSSAAEPDRVGHAMSPRATTHSSWASGRRRPEFDGQRQAGGTDHYPQWPGRGMAHHHGTQP